MSKLCGNYELCFILFQSFVCHPFSSIIYQQDQQGREQRPREAKEWKIKEFWREREKERDIESEMERTRAKEREEPMHDSEREMELLKDKERQRLDQQHNTNEKNSKGNRGRKVTGYRCHPAGTVSVKNKQTYTN